MQRGNERSRGVVERLLGARGSRNECTLAGVYSSMQPYRHPPDPPAPFDAWSPAFGGAAWTFSTRFVALLKRRELIALALAVGWADAWAFGWGSHLAGPHFSPLLAGWLALLVWLAGAPRSRPVYGAALALAGIALATAAWNGSAGAHALAVVAVIFVPAAARLRTLSVIEPLGSALAFVLLAWTRGIRAAYRRLALALVGRNVRALPWLELGVALGLLGLFGGLFTLANPFVRESGGAALSAVLRALARFDRLAIRAAGDVGLAVAFAGLLRTVPGTMLLPRHDESSKPASSRLVRMAGMTLLLQNALFAVYNSIDAVFLAARVSPPGMTLQAYAHDGALWLTVTLGFVTVVAYAFRDAARNGSPLVRRLMTAWIVQGLVLGANVFFRLALHVHTSGLSDSRFVGVFGAAAVVGGLCVVWRAIRLGHSRAWILRAQGSVLAAAVATYALVPTGVLAAAWDVAAVQRGARLPLVHVRELAASAESAPLLLPLLDDDDPIVREGVAAYLATNEFRATTLADRRAERELASRRQGMRDMLAQSAALVALTKDEADESASLPVLLAEAARHRFEKYVRYMDDQDATLSPRLPEDGSLLIRQSY